MPADSLPSEGSESLIDSHLLAVTSHSRRGRGASWELFYKGPIPICENSTLVTKSPPKDPPPDTVTLGTRFQDMNFGGM